MFAKNMGQVAPFCSEDGNHMFPNIQGSGYNRDYSFLATLRALLYKRIPKEDLVQLSFLNKSYNLSVIKNTAPKDLINSVMGRWDNIGAIQVINYSCTEEEMDAFLEILDHKTNGFLKQTGGEYLQDLTKHVADYFRLRVFINADMKSAKILVHNLDIRKYHFIQVMSMRIMPWYFSDREKFPVTEKEIALIKALNQKYATDYEAAIAAIAEDIDFRGAAINRIVVGFERRARERQLNNAEDEVSNFRRMINENVEQYNRLIRQLDDKILMVSGIRAAIENAGEGSELADFLRANRSIDPVSTDGSVLAVIVKTYLDFFDAEYYKTTSRNGQIFRFGDTSKEEFNRTENRKLYLDAIFSDDPLLRVKIVGYYQLDVRGSASAPSDYHYPPEYKNYVPNTHLQRHSCLGNHKSLIETRLRAGDVIGALSQCVASAKSLNLAEYGPTASYFLREIMESNNKILTRVSDGADLTPQEALAWLKEQKKEDK